MAKVLKITKSDKTVHVVPITNKAFYQAWNNRQPADQQYKIEEIDEKQAADLPFIDESHVSPLEAVSEVERLKARIAELEGSREILPHGQYEKVGHVGGDAATLSEGADQTGYNNPDAVVAPDTSKKAIESAKATTRALTAEEEKQKAKDAKGK